MHEHADEDAARTTTGEAKATTGGGDEGVPIDGMMDGSGRASLGNSNNSAADGMYEDEDAARTTTGEAKATTGGGDEEVHTM